MNMLFILFLFFLLVLVTEDDEVNPVCLFKFIINPHSFGQTIENLFHLSFLVRVSCTPDVCPKKRRVFPPLQPLLIPYTQGSK